MKYGLIFFYLIVGLFFSTLKAQEIDSVKLDSIKKEENLNRSIENYKSKSKFNKFIGKVFFRSTKTKKAQKTSNNNDNSIRQLKPYQGKIVRNITYDRYDPFGYSLTDSTEKPTKFFEKTGNYLHAKTKKYVIQNYVLTKPGTAFDTLKAYETERLIRQQRFIRRIKIEVNPTDNPDSIDLNIKTLDSWSIYPNLTFSTSKVGFSLRDRNFMGLGHDFLNRYRHNYEIGKGRFQTRYTIPNIQRSFIAFSTGYFVDEKNYYTKDIGLQRRFFSPLTRWAGGVYIGQKMFQDSIPNSQNIIGEQTFKYNVQDYWMGYAINLFNREQNDGRKLTNFVVSARYFNVNYVYKPVYELDPNNFYSDEEFYLFGLGVTHRDYVQDKYIMNYNIVEDIPVGLTYGVTMGSQNKNYKSRFWLQGSFKMGNYYRLGYFGAEMQYGGFLKKGKTEQSVFNLNLLYFTRLMTWNRWKFRGFLNSHWIIGNNRQDSRGDRLTLNENDPTGIEGFYSREVLGTKKWFLAAQLNTFSPWSLWGFRMSPFINTTLGLIGNENDKLPIKDVYARVGIGINFTNDFLVFNSVQLSLSWYNKIPGVGDNIFKTNALESDDYDLMNFEFGKPQIIPYNPNLMY